MSPSAPASDAPSTDPAGGPIADLAEFVALPRLEALALSADGFAEHVLGEAWQRPELL